MDISDWPMDQVMQLPDCCFGRRWPIIVAVLGKAASNSYVISKLALPETCVIWEMAYGLQHSTVIDGVFEVRLGDKLPTTGAEYQGYDPLFPTAGLETTGLFQLAVMARWTYDMRRLRMLVHAGGRRIVVGVAAGVAVAAYIQFGIVISSIPTEVPDWLISGHLRSP